jgi:hypothetical protein
MLYPALYWFARKSSDRLSIVKDEVLRGDLESYVTASHALLARIDANIRRLLNKYSEIIVWGTGQLTMKLLEDTCLRDAKIAAFVDGNPINQGKLMRGAKVLAGSQIHAPDIPILVCSLINATSILETICDLKLPNRVVTLLQGGV